MHDLIHLSQSTLPSAITSPWGSRAISPGSPHRVGSMVGQRHRRWTTVDPTLRHRPCLTLTHSDLQTDHSCPVCTQQKRGNQPMPFQCWPTVFDAGPTLKQHRVNSPCLLSTIPGRRNHSLTIGFDRRMAT